MNNKEQLQFIIDQANKASNILIVLPPEASADSVGAALALKAFLNKLEKGVVIFAQTPISQSLNFLPEFSQIASLLNVTKSFVIDVDGEKAGVEEVSYKYEQRKLSIFIKPQKGQFEPSDVSFRTSNFPFDLIICLGLASLELLGNFYASHAELFFETPLINIDYRGLNENYGQFNLIMLTATSVSEIIFDLISMYEQELIDEHIATALLTGIIAETESFQHVRTTPQAFLKASTLVSMGARQQEIVSKLYKQKSLELLKLWGRVLARLKHEQDLMLAYSFVPHSDLERSGATNEEGVNIIYQMASQLSFAKIFLFGHELSPHSTQVYCLSHLPLNLATVFAGYKPTGTPQSVKFVMSAPLVEAEARLLAMLRQNTSKLNL